MANKQCDGNCLGCSFQQQVYCSAQRTYQMMKNEEVLFARLASLEEAVGRFSNPAQVFNPLEAKKDAQKEAGAEE